MYFPVFLAIMLAMSMEVRAHMHLAYPLQLQAQANPFSTTVDTNIDAPLASDGSNFPCKNAQIATGAALTSVATWTTGSKVNFTVAGGAPHGGGSCQASLSFDGAKTFIVVHSYIGGCPLSAGQNFDFTVPADSPIGSAIFAWTWVNLIGNREFYMACSSITVAAGSGATPAVAFNSRPTIFVANLGNGCKTIENANPVFPNPGPDVTIVNAGAAGFGISGTCSAVKGNGGTVASGGSSPQSSSSSQVAVSSEKPTTFATVRTSQTSSKATSSVARASSTAAPSSSSPALALIVHPDGQCSGEFTCAGSPHGSCCSQWGWCGQTDSYCGKGCQLGFGNCGNSTPIYVNVTSAATSSQTKASSLASLITASMITASVITASTTGAFASATNVGDDDGEMVIVTMTVESTMTTTMTTAVVKSSKTSGFIAVTTEPTTFRTYTTSGKLVRPSSTTSNFVDA